MNNILITGGNGQLGSELAEIAPNYPYYNFLFTDVKDLDITNHNAVAAFVKINNITVIINCAAYTAVDKAESEPELADAINHLAVANLAQMAKKNSIKLIHISTDYVFDGTNHKPYLEKDTPNPKSVYGQTKLDGELAMQKINSANSIIIRTSWLYSRFGNNFVKTITKLAKDRDTLKVVFDQIGTPTYSKDLALALLELLPRNDVKGIYHFSNEGICSWYDFAIEVIRNQDIICKIFPVSFHEFPTKANRPSYSVLDKSKIKSYGIRVPHWKDSLSEYID